MRQPSALTVSLLYGLAFGARHAAALATVALLSRSVSVEVFAYYVLARIGLSLGNVAADMGASTALVRLVPEAPKNDKAHLVGSYFGFRGALAAGITLLCISAAAALYGMSAVQPWLLPSVAAYAAWVLSDASGHVLRAFERHRRNVAAILVGIAVQFAALVLLVVFWNGKLAAVLWAFVIGDAVVFILGAAALGGTISAPAVHWMKRLLAFGAPTSVPRWVRALSALDRHLIAAVSGVAQAAVYQVGAQAAAVVAWLESSVSSGAEPRAYAKADGGRWLSQLTARFAALAVLVAALLILFAREFVTLVASKTYVSAFLIVGPMLIVAVQHAVLALTNLRATQTHVPRVWAWTGGLDFLLSLALALIAIPQFGAEGAAWARVGGACCGLGLSLHLTRDRLAARLPTAWLAVGVPAFLMAVHVFTVAVPSVSVRVLAMVIGLVMSGLLFFLQRARSKNA